MQKLPATGSCALDVLQLLLSIAALAAAIKAFDTAQMLHKRGKYRTCKLLHCVTAAVLHLLLSLHQHQHAAERVVACHSAFNVCFMFCV